MTRGNAWIDHDLDEDSDSSSENDDNSSGSGKDNEVVNNESNVSKTNDDDSEDETDSDDEMDDENEDRGNKVVDNNGKKHVSKINDDDSEDETDSGDKMDDENEDRGKAVKRKEKDDDIEEESRTRNDSEGEESEEENSSTDKDKIDGSKTSDETTNGSDADGESCENSRGDTEVTEEHAENTEASGTISDIDKDKTEDLADDSDETKRSKSSNSENEKSTSPSCEDVVVTLRLPARKKVVPKEEKDDLDKSESQVERSESTGRVEDKMKESSKNLMEEIRKRQSGKIEDKIKRLVNKSTKENDVKGERKIVGSSKNAELKLKLEENLKKQNAKKENGLVDEKTKVVNLICRDIIAAKKDQMDRRLERNKLDESLAKPVKTIQKINLDLKSKLELGLDFNRTRTVTKRTEETRVRTETSEENGNEDVRVKKTVDMGGKTGGAKSSMLVDLENALKNKKATPHLSSKRKSVNGRKLRPKSVVDSAEGLSADDIPDLLPSLPTSAEESLDSVTELPVSVGNQLQHLVKSRPKRAKTRAPTRANPAALISNSIGEDTDDGLDAFFVAPTSGVVSPLSDDNSSISSLITDTPSPNNNNTSTPSEHKSSIITGPFTQGTSRTLPHSKCAGVGEDVPRSRSSDNVGSHSKLGTNSPDLGDSSTSETTPTPNSLSKIDGTQHLKRNTKLTGTAVDLIKAKKSASEHFNCKETVSTSCDSLSTSHSLTSSSTCNNISSSITTSTSNNITVSSIIKLRTAAFTSESNKTSSNGIPPRSPVPSKYSKDKGFEFSTSNNNNSSDKGKVASLLGGSVKQRPWSMMDQNHTLDISSSGPSSLPLHINERRSSVKAMAANLNKQGSESPELKKKPVLEPPGSVRGFGKRPVPQPRPSILRSGDSKENECNEEPFSLPPVLT